MNTAKTKDIRASLNKKGFIEEEDRDHRYFFLTINNKKTSIRTKLSHGDSEIDSFLIGKMAKQTGLTNKEFEDLIKCPLTKDEYIKLLLERGKVVI
ncbi:MAG: hypothetical protein K0R80_170 [Clostridia bacterium]|nr:hypothetical protein [Clostridia bacterium]